MPYNNRDEEDLLMITIFNRKELCVVFSMTEQSDTRAILSKHDIDYRIKTISRSSPSPFSSGTRARAGSFGQDLSLDNEYIFYVHKQDYDQALYFINNCGTETHFL